ncbi:DoxX family protein [Pseudoduganella albidiflava]|uniref:DoxX family protein n=1 Tax=Pseudoduganella albidiflava TaxID=321983 RepID=A0A411WWG2_9BURK|nr:DoxX family protein [Pseudoduganella albidiflava]QBI00827.1 DoxX family protein [Pseudoduganella albidiflava]GGY30445.1 LysR family transcriptional regulator [Pseudoduganella albidiflava]
MKAFSTTAATSTNAANAANAATSVAPAVGRVLLATIFIFSAIGKMAAPEATIGYIQSAGLPFATLGLVVAIALELGGGALLALGIKARAVAALLAGFSIVTGLAFHGAIGDQNQLIHLLKNFAMAGGLLQVVAFGAGAWSVDQWLARPAARRFA